MTLPETYDALKTILSSRTDFDLKLVTLPNSENQLYCDIASGAIGPHVPSKIVCWLALIVITDELKFFL